MTAPELLATLNTYGVRVRVTGDRLHLAPAAAVTPELLAEARRLKAELLRLLAGPKGRTTPAACGWCGAALVPYLLDLAGRPALLCTGCHGWTYAGGTS